MAKADRKKWDDLHAARDAAAAVEDEFETTLVRRYSGSYKKDWLTGTERAKQEKLRDKRWKIESKIVDLVTKISPRGDRWLRGVPAHWIATDLTWEDAIRPEDEPLSVVVPGSYGYPDGYMTEQRSVQMAGGYQGWANWETWNVALWFGNDEGLYKQAIEEAKRLDGFDASNAEDFVLDLLPDGTPDFGGDANRYDQVDWQEIADDFNEMAGIEDDGDDEEAEDAEEEEDDEEEETEEEEDDEDDEDVFSEDEMREGFIIADSRGSGYDLSHRYRHYGHYREFDDALKAANAEMERQKFYPNLYHINERGNVDLLDEDGNIIKSRV